MQSTLTGVDVNYSKFKFVCSTYSHNIRYSKKLNFEQKDLKQDLAITHLTTWLGVLDFVSEKKNLYNF